MSGHSKWAQIKRTKAKVDAARGVIFTRMSREIIVAARLGGPEPAANFRLRTAIEAARKAGVPNDNIKRAIAKGSGLESGEVLEELVYEGYGPAGVAILIRAYTDNRNRTAADLRAAFGRHGGNLGESGCVSFLFQESGQIILDNSVGDLTEEAVLEAVLEAGAQDVRANGDTFEIICEPTLLEVTQNKLVAVNFKIESAGLADIPIVMVTVEEIETAKKLLRLIDRIDELPDVQKVATNFDISDDVITELEMTFTT
ncbi:MAG: YebC/PmpR family DNA-binding transcriptional regulator [Cyanobacteria bacterium NC_groundwater_1444_Ag_S-0.65um_54_12]|nr:YebC/PmpR family DNA-binding transcriptional regulator [Cyanobacteria bacterium NC_groundwater_1444_Ag_S-0.65um_54_12]